MHEEYLARIRIGMQEDLLIKSGASTSGQCFVKEGAVGQIPTVLIRLNDE